MGLYRGKKILFFNNIEEFVPVLFKGWTHDVSYKNILSMKKNVIWKNPQVGLIYFEIVDQRNAF